MLKRILLALDTNVGINFGRDDVLRSSKMERIQYSHIPDIGDTNKHPLKLLNTITLVVQLASYKFRVNIFVCKLLGASMILESEFSDKMTQKSWPGNMTTQLENVTTIPILYRRPLIHWQALQQWASPQPGMKSGKHHYRLSELHICFTFRHKAKPGLQFT